MVLTTMLELFVSFLKIGMTSFGGMSMVPLINAEMLNHGWMTVREVADIVAIAEMTPGPLGFNCATFAGMRVAGLPGAICANLGVLFPTYSIGWVAAVFFERFKSSNIMQCLLYGIRPVCISVGVVFLTDARFWFVMRRDLCVSVSFCLRFFQALYFFKFVGLNFQKRKRKK